MSSQQMVAVRGNNGLRGVLLDPPPASQSQAGTIRVRLEDGRELQVSPSALVPEAEGYYLALGPNDIPAVFSTPAPAVEQTVIPVIAEELIVGKRSVSTGGIRVHKRVEQHDEVVDMPLVVEHLDIRRVVLNRDVDSLMPVRYEGDTTIIPLVEEVLVVEKRLRLKEEIHITRTRTEERHQERVTLQNEVAEVERLDGQGRPARVMDIPEAVPAMSQTPPPLMPEPQIQPEPASRTPYRRNRVIFPE